MSIWRYWELAKWYTTNWKRPGYPLIVATRSNLVVMGREQRIRMEDTSLCIRKCLETLLDNFSKLQWVTGFMWHREKAAKG